MARGGFACQAGELLLVGLLRRPLLLVVLQGVSRATALLQVENQGGEGLLAEGEGVDLRLCGCWKRGRAGGELFFQLR